MKRALRRRMLQKEVHKCEAMCCSNEQYIHFMRVAKKCYHNYGLGHVVLIVCYFAFILISAAVFFIIESTNSNSIRRHWQRQISSQRARFITYDLLPQIFNNSRLLVFIHNDKTEYLAGMINEKLNEYEKMLDIHPTLPLLPCTFANSLLFVCSTITTIGYGYIYPVTRAGRCFSIICSLFGIPFTIVVVQDISYLIAKLFTYPCILFVYLWHTFRYCTLKPVDEDELFRKLHGNSMTTAGDYRLQTIERLLGIPVMIAVLALVGWIVLGCAITHFYVPELDMLTAFYLVFNSLTTIGGGDIKPGETTSFALLLFAYLLIGLSAVSLFINLLHTKFSQAYWLPGRLYTPLATRSHSYLPAISKVASFDSYEEEDIDASDGALNHYVTLGVLQAEDKCPLIGVIKKDKGYRDANTQTTGEEEVPPLPKRQHSSPEALLIKKSGTSKENVNDLMTETYSPRRLRR